MENGFAVRLIIAGIDSGYVTLRPGESLEIIPMDCFIGLSQIQDLEERHGIATDGLAIRVYKDLDDLISQPVNVPDILCNKEDIALVPETTGEKDISGPENLVSSPPPSIRPAGSSLSFPEKMGENLDSEETPGLRTLKNKKESSDGSCVDISPARLTEGADASEKNLKPQDLVVKKKRKKEPSLRMDGTPRRKKICTTIPRDFMDMTLKGFSEQPRLVRPYKKRFQHGSLKEAFEMFDSFRDWHEAKGSRFWSWVAAWRTWLTKAVEFNKQRQLKDGAGAPLNYFNAADVPEGWGK